MSIDKSAVRRGGEKVRMRNKTLEKRIERVTQKVNTWAESSEESEADGEKKKSPENLAYVYQATVVLTGLITK